MSLIFHLFHLVELSPWPIFSGVGALNLTLALVVWFKFNNVFVLLYGVMVLLCVSGFWFRDISRESIFQGKHSFLVERGLQMGMILFIFSEIMFFFSFFWSFFHSSVSPNLDLGGVWPPFSLLGIGPFEVPALNTLILLSSGVSVTWAHFFILSNKPVNVLLLITVVLGGYFTFLQYFEYSVADFSFSDSVFGSLFFMATGFHGAHVIIGSFLLLGCLWRVSLSHFSLLNPVGLELSIWYWHFVDVVWLFLFSFIYWWGAC